MGNAKAILNNWETKLMEWNKPLNDLHLKIEGSKLEKLIDRLHYELDQKGD